MEMKGKTVEELTNKQWIIDLGFLTDLTKELNQLNKRLQGKNKLICDMYSDVKSFEMKLKLFIKHIDEKKLDHFPNCKKAVEEAGNNFVWENITMRNVLAQLQTEFVNRFTDFKKSSLNMEIFQNPFGIDIHLYNQMQIRPLTEAEVQSRKTITQWVIWFCGVVPVAVYIQTRPRRAPPPLMIWITANPWHRREMGPYGYYLHRPLSSLQSHTALGTRAPAPALRRAYSDSKIVIQEPSKKKRYSKSV
ncbi:unnamed protein product [Plutella xylostella]|uniref:(diamondback moth) hypothetical protein n=1 Tax=Plutella xylostella TaxID=51655 RepID=A0A8S4FBH0_PLUXY|nr:unnamed protein product [Plutella xylostella]